jgi:hypothetical protein
MISVSARAAATKTAASFKFTKLSNWLILGILELLKVYNLLFRCVGVRVKNRSAAKITVNVIEQERNVLNNVSVWIVRMARFISTIHISNQEWKSKLTLDFLTCIFILLLLHIFYDINNQIIFFDIILVFMSSIT